MLPAGFNQAFLWLLPKDESNTDAAGTVIVNPETTRPLSGANTDAKLFACAMRAVLDGAVADWAHPSQRGFLRGRNMVQNVIDVERAGVIAGIQPNNRAATFLFDFKAAFPSLSRAFIFRTLETVGIPPHIVAAIQALYSNNDHVLKIQGQCYPAFRAAAGVRQGCPLSSIIFVIATDSITRYLEANLGPTDCLRAYADDIAILLHDVVCQLEFLHDAFVKIEAATCLALNKRKCVMLPCWKWEHAQALAILQEDAPNWTEFRVDWKAIYLGFGVGINGYNESWVKPITKLIARMHDVRAAGAGLAASMVLYNIFCVSVLSHVAQIRPPPRLLVDVVQRHCCRLIPARYQWISAEALWHVRAILLFPVAPMDPITYCHAVAARYAIAHPGPCDLPCIDEAINDCGQLTHLFPTLPYVDVGFACSRPSLCVA